MSRLDSEGYTKGSPDGLRVLVVNWEDFRNNWNPDQDWTGPIGVAYASTHGWDPNYIKAHPGYDPATDPLMTGLGGVLQRLVAFNYQDQVTGKNLQDLSDNISSKIRGELSKISAIADTDWLPGFALSLTQTGEYSGQLASRSVAVGYLPNPNGDILRMKYVTHGNYAKFEVGLNFLGQLLDPIGGVFTDGPSFTVYFDTVTRIDLQLPHNFHQGITLLSAVVHLAGADLHAENYSAALALDAVESTVDDTVNNYQMDLTSKIGDKLQDINNLIGQFGFDQADYSINVNDPTDTSLTMKFTQHPSRDFRVNVDYLDGQPSRGPVQNYATVLIGFGEPPTEVQLGPGYFLPVSRQYFPTAPPDPKYGNGSRNVVIQVAVSRRIVNKPVGGHLVNRGGHYYAYYDDGQVVDLGPDFNANDPMALRALFPRPTAPLPADLKCGLLEINEVFVDYALQYISGRYPDNSVFKIKATPVPGQPGSSAGQVSIPGRGGRNGIPEIRFTITMSGTRNGFTPDEVPSNPPRRGTHLAANALSQK